MPSRSERSGVPQQPKPQGALTALGKNRGELDAKTLSRLLAQAKPA